MPRITIAQWKQSLRRLGKEFRPALERGMRLGAERGIVELQRATEEAPPASPNGGVGAHDRGNYKAGWRKQVTRGRVRFYNVTPYADVIERGRRPNRAPPPADKLLPWVKRKLKYRNQKMARQIARAVAFTIGKRGLRGRHVLQSVEQRLGAVISMEIERELDFLLRKI